MSVTAVHIRLASCPWGPGVDILTELYVIYMEKNIPHPAAAEEAIICEQTHTHTHAHTESQTIVMDVYEIISVSR